MKQEIIKCDRCKEVLELSYDTVPLSNFTIYFIPNQGNKGNQFDLCSSCAKLLLMEAVNEIDRQSDIEKRREEEKERLEYWRNEEFTNDDE